METKKISHIARLARIRLSSEEESRYTEELSRVIDFIDALKGLDVSSSESGRSLINAQNVCRSDASREEEFTSEAPELIAAASETERGWIKVKVVF